MVLLFIADRTHGWGKPAEVITHDHFLRGIQSKDSKTDYAGAISMSHPTLISSLRYLSACGAIKTRKTRKLTEYEINLDWLPIRPLINDITMPLAKPKRLTNLHTLQPTEREFQGKMGKESLPEMGKESLPMNVKKIYLKKDKEKNGKVKKIDPSDQWRGGQEESDQEASLEDRLESASSRSRASRQRRIDKWTLDSVVPAWQAALALHHPGSPILTNTRVQCMALLRYGKKWIAAVASRSIADWLAYLNWCIAKWVAIRTEHFHWMTSSPEVPAMGFLVKLADRFEQAYTAKESLEAMGRLSTRERSIERRMRAGMERETAEKEVDDRTGLTEERERIEAAAQAIKRQRLASQVDERERAATERRKADHRAITERTRPSAAGTFDTWL